MKKMHGVVVKSANFAKKKDRSSSCEDPLEKVRLAHIQKLIL